MESVHQGEGGDGATIAQLMSETREERKAGRIRYVVMAERKGTEPDGRGGAGAPAGGDRGGGMEGGGDDAHDGADCDGVDGAAEEEEESNVEEEEACEVWDGSVQALMERQRDDVTCPNCSDCDNQQLRATESSKQSKTYDKG